MPAHRPALLALSTLFACSGGGTTAQARVTVQNDEAALAARLDATSAPVPVQASPGGGRAFSAPGSLTLVATVSPPVIAGQTLQATSVTLAGDYAYVSYAMRGGQNLGAVDVVQVRNVKAPVLLSQVTFADTDIDSVLVAGSTLYVVGATSDPSFASPAVLETITVSSGKLSLAGNARRGLSSYTATSVAMGAGKLYVTTGNTGGLSTVTASGALPVASTTALRDARWVDQDGTHVVVAQGTPATLSVFQQSTLSLLHSFTLSGATIPESKSTVRLIGGKALLAAGDGGVQLVSLATGAVLGQIARATVAGLDPSVSVTNAVDAAGSLVFSANGEAGISLATAAQALEPLSGELKIALATAGKLQFSALQSANHVAFDGQTLAVAAGLGGSKFVSVSGF